MGGVKVIKLAVPVKLSFQMKIKFLNILDAEISGADLVNDQTQ